MDRKAAAKLKPLADGGWAAQVPFLGIIFDIACDECVDI